MLRDTHEATMTKRQRAGVRATVAMAVAALLAVACASPTPSPSPSTVVPTSPIAPSPHATATPAPSVVCEDRTADLTTLTCAKAVAAATAVVGFDAKVVSIEFHYGHLPCPPGARCAAPSPDQGYVLFHVADFSGDIIVGVLADRAGIVSAGVAEPVATDSAG
jgi:hypothetical protein